MLNSILTGVSSSNLDFVEVLICVAVALVLGGIIGIVHTYKNTYTKAFIIALTLLPTIVMTVIMVINGNLGAGIAVAGGFSLIRFRSQPGTAREITSLFLAMATGFAIGMGYIGMAVLVVLIVSIVMVILQSIVTGKDKNRQIKVTIPENLDYENIFEDVFKKYALRSELLFVKTTNMGSLFELNYNVSLKGGVSEKEMLDEMRTKNGNLPIVCGRVPEKEFL